MRLSLKVSGGMNHLLFKPPCSPSHSTTLAAISPRSGSSLDLTPTARSLPGPAFVQAARRCHRSSLLGWCCSLGVLKSCLACEPEWPATGAGLCAFSLSQGAQPGRGYSPGGSGCLQLMAEWQPCSYIIGFSPPFSFQSQISH